MKSFTTAADELARIPNLLPRDYFHGVRSRNLCLPDNILVFLRAKRGALQRRNFESRPHHRHVLVICFETSGSINVDGSVFHLQPGDAFLIKPYQFHFHMEIAQERVAWLFITFETANPVPFESFANVPVRLQETDLQRAIAIARSYSECDGSDATGQDRLVLATLILLNEIRWLSQQRAKPLINTRPSSSTGYAIVDRINSLLDGSLCTNSSIQEIARDLALSESHLRKRFKALTGLSLGSYLVHYKLNRAVKLLVHSEASLTQISVECGYESLAAFSRSFKTKLGIPPSRYRKTSTFPTADSGNRLEYA